jgi:hypothetical protein
MAPPTDQFASAPNADTLWTEADQAKYPEFYRSCILGLGTANPEQICTLTDFGNLCLELFGYQDMPLARSFVERICKRSLPCKLALLMT